MKHELNYSLKTFNQIYKEMDILYHNYAKNAGLSDTAFWILYSLSERNNIFTQRELCEDWSFAPQTINSALKELEKRGIATLESVPGNKKNKWIKLTEDGGRLVERVVYPLMQAENDSFDELPLNECEAMLVATRKYLSFLKEKISATQATVNK